MTDDNKAIALEKLHKLSSVLKTPSVERKLRDAAAKATEAVESDATPPRARKSAAPRARGACNHS